MAFYDEEPPSFVEYNGTATVNGSMMRVTVLAKEGGWKRKALEAVKKAGGYNAELDDGKPETVQSVQHRYNLGEYRVAYDITFTRDSVLANASKQSITILLRSDLSQIHDGDFQKYVKKAKSQQRMPGQNLVTPLRYKP